MLLITTIYILTAGAIGLTLCFNYAILKYYTDPHESVKISLGVQLVSLSVVWIFILAVPFDVYAAVSHQDANAQLKLWDLYVWCSGVLVSCLFIWLPFSYYYAIISGRNGDEDLITADGGFEDTLGMKGLDSSSSEEDELAFSIDSSKLKRPDFGLKKNKAKGMTLLRENIQTAFGQTGWSVLWLAILLLFGYAGSH